MRPLLLIVLVILGAMVGYLLFWPLPVQPVAWTPIHNPGLVGVFEKNNELTAIERIAVQGVGPEDVTQGPDGLLYTGVEDGRILRLSPSSPAGIETFVNTGGRPLGLQFDASGNLIVADGVRGLLSVSKTRDVTVLADIAGGSAIRFADDLDIAQDGTIWFSDATALHPNDPLMDFFEGRATGRLLSYDPRSGECKVRMTGLRFANGVALDPDDAYVLVTETLGARILRLWLKGPKAGESDVFVDALPGYPDNLSYDGNGQFWVALPAIRSKQLEWLANRPWLRAVIMRLPNISATATANPIAWAISVDLSGKVQANLQDWTGAYSSVTSVNRFGDTLYLGSIEMEAVARVPVPTSDDSSEKL